MGIVELYVPGTAKPTRIIANVKSITVHDGYTQIYVVEALDDIHLSSHTINTTLDYIYYEDGYQGL